MRNKDEMDGFLREAQKPQPVNKIHKIQHEDGETLLGKNITRVVWEEDPNNPGILMPMTVTEVTRNLDADGLAFPSNPAQVGRCRFKDMVRMETLRNCNHCRRTVCMKHAITLGTRYYCRKRPCSWIARFLQVFSLIYWVLRFFFLSVTGLYTDDSRKPGKPFDIFDGDR